MSAESEVSAIIANAQSLADELVAQAQGLADDAQTAAITVTDLGTLDVPVRPNVSIPTFPADADMTEQFRNGFDGKYDLFGDDLMTKYDAYLAQFFPEVADCLPTSIDAWICDVIDNGTTGIPAAVEAQIWDRARAKELRDFQRRDEELVNGWAERGFSLPPGALFAAQQKLQQDVTEKISTMARDLAIKQAEIQIETIKFAVQQGITLRLGALGALNDYLRTWLTVPKLAVEFANGIILARARLFDSIGSYYSALVAAERLVYDWGKDQVTHDLVAQDNFVKLVNSNTNARVQAAVQSAEVLAAVARAVLGAQNTLAKIGNETIVSQ